MQGESQIFVTVYMLQIINFMFLRELKKTVVILKCRKEIK